MELSVIGQRCVSEREPELGLGVVASVDAPAKRIGVEFPATGERRLYALGTAVLKRVKFRPGERITLRNGRSLVIERADETDGVIWYVGEGQRAREDEVSDVTSVTTPLERLATGRTDPSEVFDLRLRALEMRARLRESELRGFLGGRVELIPHQFYIVHEVATRQNPRVLLADEVGLGKTIEACLIIQRLLAVGQARRVLVLVPETLTHQWFVELLRRFNLWFSIYDAERCAALEASDPGANPFLAAQLALASVSFLAGDEVRRKAAIAAGWDLVVVDEAHHLAWTPTQVSREYELVEQLAQRSPGLLLLTATPTQLGMAGHFARLRLLDPSRYGSYERFLEESERFGAVAGVADRIVSSRPLRAADRTVLEQLFNRDAARLQEHLDAVEAGKPDARPGLLRVLLDQYGTGRVVFRNTRAAMSGFPKRKFCPAPLAPSGSVAQLARIARELQAEETGADASIRYTFKEDPRIEWLAAFLREHRTAKVLLICRSQRKVAAIDAALQDRIKAKAAVFHEGLALVQRDRNAAWFAEPDGAQLLLCSEIGSEGRNFQFAHHLVLFDLPLNPGLVEQRIGRLDRIGQTQTIRIHVPYVQGSADECVTEWYHRGVAAFENPLHGAEDFEAAFKPRLLELALAYARGGDEPRGELEALVAETAAFRAALADKMKRGRDRLLELASFDATTATRVIGGIRASDADPQVRQFLYALLDHFGVRLKDHEGGDVFLDPSHAYLEAFPSIPADGMLATFDRRRASAREDIRFLSADHPLVGDAIDLLVDSPAGTTAYGTVSAKAPNLLLEAVFLLEPMAEARWNVDRFLAPTPVRVVVDVRGNDLTGEREPAAFAGYVADGDLHRFLENPGFSVEALRRMAESAGAQAETAAAALRASAAAEAKAALTRELQRLKDLQKLNDNVRAEEIQLAKEQLEQTVLAVTQARVRLDSVRLIVERP